MGSIWKVNKTTGEVKKYGLEGEIVGNRVYYIDRWDNDNKPIKGFYQKETGYEISFDIEYDAYLYAHKIIIEQKDALEERLKNYDEIINYSLKKLEE